MDARLPSASHPSIGDGETVLQRARAMIPALRERAEESERLRALPQATVDDLRSTGVHRVFQPARFGGSEAHFRIGVDVLAALGQGCASTAWVVVQNMTHNLMLAHWPDEAQQDVWGAAARRAAQRHPDPRNGAGASRRRWLRAVRALAVRQRRQLFRLGTVHRDGPQQQRRRLRIATLSFPATSSRSSTRGTPSACAAVPATTSSSATCSSPNTAQSPSRTSRAARSVQAASITPR